MKPAARLLRIARPALLSTVAVLSCFNAECGCLGPGSSILGVWSATEFLTTPNGQAQIDVLAAGGSLTITINDDNSTTGTLTIPATVTGAAPLMASMAGTMRLNAAGTEVTFDQAADTFVRDLIWQLAGASSLTVSNQVAGSAAFSITLTRQ